jgi:hypothetical protein
VYTLAPILYHSVDASEDKEYISFCENVLKSQEVQYESIIKKRKRYEKAHRVCFPFICSLFPALITYFVWVAATGPGPFSNILLLIVIELLVTTMVLLALELSSYQEDIISNYENHPTCADKITFYVGSYENWIERDERKERQRRQQEKLQEESQRVCAAIHSAA